MHEWARVFLKDGTIRAVNHKEVDSLTQQVFQAIRKVHEGGDFPVGVLIPTSVEHIAKAGPIIAPSTFTRNTFEGLLFSGIPLFVGDVEKIVALEPLRNRVDPITLGWRRNIVGDVLNALRGKDDDS